MLIELLVSILLGALTGAVTGILPGIHLNLVGIFLVSLSSSLLISINKIYLAVFIVSVAIAHLFIDFIPSIFLGCPEEETSLSVLPGHEMLKEGKGYEAVRLTSIGAIYAIFIFLIIAFPSSFLISKIYNLIQPFMFFILFLLSLILIFSEKHKFSALFVFLLSGILGLCVLNSNVNLNEPLLPLLTGLFGSPLLILSIKNKTKLQKQVITEPSKGIKKPIFSSLFASFLCGFLPGLGSGQASALSSAISKPERKSFLVLTGAVNVLVMCLSFVTLYSISKIRTGVSASLNEIIGIFSWKILLLFLFAILISGIISFFLTKYLAKIASKQIEKINYSLLSKIILIFLTFLIIFISGWLGLLVFISSTSFGIYCNTLKIKKTQMMGCLLVPTIWYYLMMLII